ncbi:MAG: replication-associated recombination protein A [Dehalococcoidia bacterium]|nr:replication-associated recombination protein A [Dehalococcoidia bacterium]
MDMFDHQLEKDRLKGAPLAARMRPATLAEFVGQEHIIGEGRVLRRAINSGTLPSVVLWGPPGSGKTTLAYIMAQATSAHFSSVSAVSAGVADLRKVIEEARERRKLYGQRTLLFIDEIHRFNKAQQDAILPHVEDGTVTFIGATTENPSFEVISPLLSRSQVFVLKPLAPPEIAAIVSRAIDDRERGLGAFNVALDEPALDYLVSMSNADARTALNALEVAAMTTPPDVEGRRFITLPVVEDAVQHRAILYDKNGEQHYDIISALHKTMRGSDPDAALYWLARMVEAGDDPLYIVRRLVRFASEDVGMADPQALVVAMAAQQAVHFIGMPEGNLALAQAVVYLATAPKSNSLYTAYSNVRREVTHGRNEPVPLHLRNAPTKLMRDIGYGEGYKYAHEFKGHFVRQQNLPDSLKGRQFYEPSEQGFEKQVLARLKNWWPERYGNKSDESKPDR